MASRTQHAKRNIITSVINKVVTMLAAFVMRTVLITYLGKLYLGLDSLFVSILQILSLAELGISSALVYSMYKPLAENNTPAICALLKLYRNVYRYIGIAIAVLGLGITPFLPLIVKDELPGGINLYALYFINLSNTVLSYLCFSYRTSLFTADQRYSINNNIYTAFKVASTVAQIAAIIIFRDHYYCYYIYSIVLPLTTILKNFFAYWLSKKKYPQYVCEGNVSKEEMSGIKKRVAGMFLYKVSFVFRNSFDSIVLSAFLGLSVLGQYNNYYYVIHAISDVMILVSNSVTASVGNSIVVESKEKNYNDFKKLQLLYMWMSSWLTICILVCLQPFVKMWVGEGMMFNDGIMIIFCVYFFTTHFSRICYVYRQAAGMWWQDRLRPIAETVINLSLNILLVKFIQNPEFKVTGVMFSTIFCILFIDCTWGARTLFKYYFTEEKMSKYMLKLLYCWGLTAISGAICYFTCKAIGFEGVKAIIVNGCIATVVSNVIFGVGSSFLPEFKPSVQFLFKVVGVNKILKKLKK
ncbi:MAG: oligosaccharide flippase family protein [Clostridia bacterium]|nr:oligosaccharide flippase family protein [Clostridia bacterium]